MWAFERVDFEINENNAIPGLETYLEPPKR